MKAPDQEWLKWFMSGPLCALLNGNISYGKFLEHTRNSGMTIHYGELYPVLFNSRWDKAPKPEIEDNEPLLEYDIGKAAQKFMDGFTPCDCCPQ